MASEPTRIPIRQIVKDITNVTGDTLLVVDDGFAMGRAKASDAVDKRAATVADTKIAALALGTASKSNTEDFATPAQGSKADSAIQPADLAPVAAKANSAVQTLAAGVGITIDATDPNNPIVINDGDGSGDMLKANNLSDVTSVSAALTNLGIGPSSGDKFKALVANADGSAPEYISPGYINCAQLGAIPSMGVKDAEMAAAISVAASLNEGLLIPAGTYHFTKEVDFSPLLSGAGKVELGGDVVFNFTGAANVADFPNGAHVFLDAGPLVAIPGLANSPVQGDGSVNILPGHGLVKGDRFCIWNPTDGSFNAARPVYRAGEFCKVASTSGDFTVKLFGSLYAGYTAGTVNVYKHPNKKIEIAGGTITIIESEALALADVAGFRAERIVDSDLSAFRPTNSGYAGIALIQCVDLFGTGYKTAQNRLSGNSYGLVYANCQGLDLEGEFGGGRHGATGGGIDGPGSVPCRGNRIRGKIYNAPDSTVPAADWHGNCELNVYDGVLDGGLSCGGDKNSAAGSTIIGKNNQNGNAIMFAECLGTDFDLSNTKISTRIATPTNYAVVDIGSNNVNAVNANTVRGGIINLDGAEFDCPLVDRLIVMRNRGCVTTEETGLSLRGARYKKGVAGGPIAVFMDALSGKTLDRLDLHDFANDAGGTYAVTVGKIRGWRAHGSTTLTPSTSSNSVQVTSGGLNAPKPPRVQATPPDSIIGGKRSIVYGSATSSIMTIGAASCDAANFTVSTPVSVAWTAVVDE